MVNAQQSPSRKATQLYQEALKELNQGTYEQAAKLLGQCLGLDSNFAEAHQVLADLYRRNGAYQQAVDHYRKVTLLKPELTPNTWFGLGESLLKTGQYAPALIALERYESYFSNEPARRKNSGKYIQDCRFSLAYFEKNKDIVQSPPHIPVNLGTPVNTPHDEYFPKLIADHSQMIFTRKANDQENFYSTRLDGKGGWTEAVPLEGQINSRHFNEGAHCISPDGKYLYFTGCNRPDGLGSCDIYVSKKTGDLWGPPRNLGPTINTSGWEAQPALSADGHTLYFVSNRRGGIGGYDIWKSSMQENGAWGGPVNLGPSINTVFDEIAPFIHADNKTLYFSSNGWPGLGDKDIFVSTQDSTGKWQQPINMGYPINDHREQSAWSVSMNGKQAFFSSNTDGGTGGLDIYSLGLAPAWQPTQVAYLDGKIIDAGTGSALGNAEILITDLSTGKQTYKHRSDTDDGTFLAPLVFGRTYGLHISLRGYLMHSDTYRLDRDSTSRDEYTAVFELEAFRMGQSEILRNIFFETGKYDLLPESRAALHQLHDFLIANPKVRIEIGGHTDNTGNETSNLLLSEKRAESVRDFLIGLGIPAGRISHKGYGQHQPVAGNDTEEKRQQNRRTDFRITGF